MKSTVTWALCALMLCLTACSTLSTTRHAERAKLCQQEAAPIPDPPADVRDLAAYALRLLGVIEQDRTAWRVERECVADV